MNQILDYGDGNNENVGKSKKSNFGGGNNYNSGMNNRKTPVSDKIIKVFAFLMIVLAIALIASGAMSLLKNKKDEDTKKAAESTKAPAVQAEILAELEEITGNVKITVNSSIPITKMLYSWDEEHDNVVGGEKQTSLETETLAPSGKHVLHVSVTDEQNNKTIKEFTFDSAIGIDSEKPEIKLSITEDKKLLVKVTDDTSISYVTYTWNEQETVTMTPEEEDAKEYEFDLEIPKGKNTIVVFAVDGSEEGNATTVSKVLEGVTKPEIKKYEFLDSEGKQLQITVAHENGIKSIQYKLNGQLYEWAEEPQQEITFTVESEIGHNELELTVTSVDDTKEELAFNWGYKEDEAASNDGNTAENDGEASENTTSNETTENN